MQLRGDPTLWTVHAVHSRSPSGSKGDAPRENFLKAWRKLAASTVSTIDEALRESERRANGEELRNRDVHALFDDAREPLTGDSLTRFRLDPNRLNYRDDSPLTERVTELRELYEIDDLERPHGDRAARALILFAAEYRFLPYAEGTLAAIRSWPTTPRFDLRSIFHLVTRWWHECDPAYARLAVAGISPNGHSRPWLPLTRVFEAVLRLHLHDVSHARDVATTLSKTAIQQLHDQPRTNATLGAMVRRLLTTAERLNVIERRPQFDTDPDVRRRHELTWILLEQDIGFAPTRDVSSILELLRPSAVVTP